MIFPAPHARETIASYGYRIARLSGLSSLLELAYLFDLDLRALLMGDDYSIQRLARYTGCDPAALASGALDASNPRRLKIGTGQHNTVKCCPHSFRFCPACLAGLADGDFRSVCLGRTDWLVDANHVCAEHGIRLSTIPPHKTARVHKDLSAMIPRLVAARSATWQAIRPTTLEGYIFERLAGTLSGRWIDDIQLDVVIHTAEIFGALVTCGPQASWKDISTDERREHGHLGAEVMIEGSTAIKDFLRAHIGRGRYGNDYRNAFGLAFNEFYFRKDQPAYRPICVVLAEYVGETFRFTGQDKVFGIKTRGVQPTILRSLCSQHGIGLKITSQVLKAQYGIRAGASCEVDPALIADLAPKLKDLLNAQDAARYLGVSVDVVRGLISDGLLVPDYMFNERMSGFSGATLKSFIEDWCDADNPPSNRRRSAGTPIQIVARANRVRISRLLMAARAFGRGLYRDHRKLGLTGVVVVQSDIAALVECAKSYAESCASHRTDPSSSQSRQNIPH